MSEPDLQQQAGVYHLWWQDECIHIRVDKVRTDKYGVYGELLIQTTAPGHYPHIHGPVQTNLTGSNARRDLARHLAERVGLDWATILEQAFHKDKNSYGLGIRSLRLFLAEISRKLTTSGGMRHG